MSVASMKKRVARAKAAKAAVTTSAQLPKQLPGAVDFIARSRFDPRVLVPHPANRPFPTAGPEWASFEASIREMGVIVPLICRLIRVDDEERCQIVCGHRRQQAAIEVGLADVPIELREMDDRTAVALLVTENLQRRNPTPLEQGRGIQAMIEAGWELDGIAAELGMSPGVVARRRQLTHLVPAWQELIDNQDHRASKAPVAVLERIARLPAEVQVSLANDAADDSLGRDWLDDVECFRSAVEMEMLTDLAAAGWSLDDATLYPEAGACSACPKRSGAQPLLWDDEVVDVQSARKTSPGVRPDRCLDPACYRAKRERAVLAIVEEKRKQYPDLVVLTSKSNAALDAKKFGGARVMLKWGVDHAKKGAPGALPAIEADGRGRLQVCWVRPYGAGGGPSAKKARPVDPKTGKAKPKSLAERRKELECRRKAWVVDRVREELREIADDDARKPVTFAVTDYVEADGGSLHQLICEAARLFLLRLDLFCAEAVVKIPEPKSWAAEGKSTTKPAARKAR